MKKIIRLSESDLVRVVRRIIKEQEEEIFATHPSLDNRGIETWMDKEDNRVGSEIEFSDVREFGPEDYDSFMEYINNCDTKWCLKTKMWYDRYANMGKLRVGKGIRK